jgi:hypothetical protein
MIFRRYYPRGFKGKTYSEDYLASLRDKGVDTDVVDTASYELILNKEEQVAMWNNTCAMILNPDRTRWVLDNLEYLQEYKVNWHDYRSQKAKDKRKKPRQYTKKPKAL